MAQSLTARLALSERAGPDMPDEESKPVKGVSCVVRSVGSTAPGRAKKITRPGALRVCA